MGWRLLIGRTQYPGEAQLRWRTVDLVGAVRYGTAPRVQRCRRLLTLAPVADTDVRLCHPVHMNRKTLAFIATAISILYGVGFAVFDDSPSTYAVIGGAVVAIAWIAVGSLGKPDEQPAPPVAPRDRT